MPALTNLLKASLITLAVCVFSSRIVFAQPLQLQGAVGAHRPSPPVPNNPDDVSAVKSRLRNLGYTWLTEGSEMDELTIHTIRLFQAIINGHERVVDGRGVDGIVDVNGATQRWLNRDDAPRWQLMPEQGTGFYNYERLDQPGDDHDYGTDWLATTIEGAGGAYQTNYRSQNPQAALITLNNASRNQGRNTPIHKGHETGLMMDLRLPKNDGSAGAITFSSPEYDRAATRAMLTALHQQPLLERARCNDPVLAQEVITIDGTERKLCVMDTSGNVHDNHIHIDIHPPL